LPPSLAHPSPKTKPGRLHRRVDTPRKGSPYTELRTILLVSKLLQMKPQTVFHSRIILLTLILLFGVIPSTSAQQSPEVHVDIGGPASNTVSDILRRHNIGLTEAALLRALKNPDAEVRWPAAMKLAEDKAVDAIPAVRHTLSAEKVPRARVNTLSLINSPKHRMQNRRVTGSGPGCPRSTLGKTKTESPGFPSLVAGKTD
jgi:hypothetical protein